MKKNEAKELMQLSLYGELSDTEQAVLEAAMKKYPELKKEFRQLKKFAAFVTEHTPPETAGPLLAEARTHLRQTLRKERSAVSAIARIMDFARELYRPKVAFGGIGILSLGMLIGYYAFAPSTGNQQINIQPVMDAGKEQPGTSITNIRFIDNDATDGEVEFEFDAVATVRMKGNIHDAEIQKVLTHALLNESNAGVRLSTMNALSNQTGQSKHIDPAIKSALISSLTSDANPGVRREALRVLQQCEFDNEIRDAILQVIARDQNSGIRVAAINALSIAKMEGTTFDDKTINALKQQIEKEQNNYIRNRAVNLVKEIYQ